MKKVFLIASFFFSLTFFAQEQVGITINYEQKSNFKENEYIDAIYFKDASFIKIHLKELFLKEGDSLTIYNENETFTIDGPFNKEVWLPSLTSEDVYILLKGSSENKPYFEIDQIGLGFKQDRIESICENDDRKNAVCYSEEMQSAADPVGRMLFQSGGAWYACTGSIVSQNGHFLTNNHCISDQFSASTLEVWWRYQASSCSGTTGTKEYTTTGSTFITTNEDLDFTLLQISDSYIAKYGYIPIANREPVKGERIWIPQHGGGTIKRFAVESDLDQGGYAVIDDDNADGYLMNSDIGYYADTEGGSSGSPVLDSSNKMIAIHHFGLPIGYSCGEYMNQGVKMSLIYPLIASYLGQVIPPRVDSISKATNPFRLIIKGDKFNQGIEIYIGETLWSNVSYKSEQKLVLKKGNSLKSLFPKGVPVTITLTNPDGGTTSVTYTR